MGAQVCNVPEKIILVDGGIGIQVTRRNDLRWSKKAQGEILKVALKLMMFMSLFVGAYNTIAAELPSCDYSAALGAGHTIVIDANTGVLLSDDSAFPNGERVQLYFVHKNPFRYTYAYDIKGVLIDPAIIRAALEKLGLFPTDTGEEDAAAEGEGRRAADDAAARRMAQSCDAIGLDSVQTILAVSTLRRDEASRMRTTINSLDANARKFDNTVSELNAAVPTTIRACKDLRSSTTSLRITIADIKSDAESLKETVKVLQDLRSELDSAVPSVTVDAMRKSLPNCRRPLDIYSNLDEALNSNIRVANGAAGKFKAKSAQVLTAEVGISDVLGNLHSFVEARSIGPVGEATDFAIAITRTSRADNADKATIKVASSIRLGEPRFSYSVGAGFGFADLKDYGRVASVSETGELGNVVGITEESSTQIGVVAQLNGRIGHINALKGSSWGWSLGAAISQGADSAQFGVYTGPYVSIGRRMFITAAYHLVEEKSLAGGFQVGDPVPDGLQGDVPTRTKNTGALLLTLTYSF